MEHPVGGPILRELNPEFKVPEGNFLRMTYKEAIDYLRKHDIKKEDGTYYEYGEVRISKRFVQKLSFNILLL